VIGNRSSSISLSDSRGRRLEDLRFLFVHQARWFFELRNDILARVKICGNKKWGAEILTTDCRQIYTGIEELEEMTFSPQ
jgi:hypothetical protein